MNRKTPKSPGKKGLDRQMVLDCARELCGSGGVERLSIKELAQSLGIQPPSVYAHFNGLPALRRALALWGHRALAEQLRAATTGLQGEEALLALGDAYLAFIRSEPGLYSATVATPDEGDVELRAASEEWIAVLYDGLADLGLAPDDVGHALRGIRSIVHGFGQLESSGAFRGPLDPDVSFAQVLRIFVEAVAGSGGRTQRVRRGRRKSP